MEILKEFWEMMTIWHFLLSCTPIFIIIYVGGYLKYRKEQIKIMEKLIKQECEGPHKWLSMSVGKDEVHVCETCHWCPKRNGFLKKQYLDAEMRAIQFRSELKKHTEEKLKELELSQEVYDKVINIKKDFVLKFLEERLEEEVER